LTSGHDQAFADFNHIGAAHWEGNNQATLEGVLIYACFQQHFKFLHVFSKHASPEA